MKLSRTENAKRNIIYGFLEKVVNLLIPFIMRTVVIYILGIQYLGLGSLFTSILSILSLSELGLSSAICYSMYKPIAEDDEKTICALINFYRKSYRIVGSIILGVGLCLLPFLEHLIKGSCPSDVNVYILYLIYLLNTVVTYFFFSYKSAVLTVYQRRDVISKINTFVNLVQYSVQIILLFVFKNYYAYVIVLPFFAVFNNLCYAYAVKRLFPDYKCKGELEPEQKQDLKKRVIGMVSHKIAGVVTNSVDSVVISAFLGLTILGMYNNYYYFVTSIGSFLGIIINAITAGVGNSLVTEDMDVNYKGFNKFTFMMVWIVSWCAICLLCLYQHFMVMWVGKELLLPFSTVILLAIDFYVLRADAMGGVYKSASGVWWEDKLRPAIAALTNLGINIILVNFIGLNGVLLSTIIVRVFINYIFGTRTLFKYCFCRSPKDYFIKMEGYKVVAVFVGAVTYGVCSLVPSEGIGPFVVKMGICVIVPNMLMFLIYFRTRDFKEAEAFVRNNILHKRK